MSFCPIHFIFIGCIGYPWEFFLGTQIFRILTRKRNIFTKMSYFDFSKNAIFGDVMSKIEFQRIWLYGYALYAGFGSKLVIDNFSQHLIIKIGHIGRFIKKSKKSFFRKNRPFFDRKSSLGASNRVQQENHGSPKSASTFPTNPQN